MVVDIKGGEPILVFVRKVLEKICGPKQENDGGNTTSNSRSLAARASCAINVVKTKRLRYASHSDS
jgi:hypothetical protein